MASWSRVMVVLVCGFAIGLGAAAKPAATFAAGPCRASYVVLGRTPLLTGQTPTYWLNVFGENFDPTVPVTLMFGVPVIPWSVDQPNVVQPAVTTFSIPAEYMSAVIFKWTFRARDPGVQTISVRIIGKGCQASTVVDFWPPTTSTAVEGPAPSDRSPAEPLLLLLAFAGGALAVRRRLDDRIRGGA